MYDKDSVIRYRCSAVASRFTILVVATLAVMAVFVLSAKTAQAQVTVDPADINFGDEVVGDTSGVELLTITNEGLELVTIDPNAVNLFSGNSEDFALVSADGTPITAPITILPGLDNVVELGVTFSPTVEGPREATLTLLPGVTVNLVGTGVAPTVITPPDITYLSPKNKIKNRKPLISATVTDRQTELIKANIKVFLDGKEVTNFDYDQVSDKLSFRPEKRLRAGKRHKVEIRATDGVESTTKTKTFRVIRRH